MTYYSYFSTTHIKVTYHFPYVISHICESLGNESVIALLHLQNMYFLDSVVQLQETYCYFHKQQELQKNHRHPFFNVAHTRLNVLFIYLNIHTLFIAL